MVTDLKTRVLNALLCLYVETESDTQAVADAAGVTFEEVLDLLRDEIFTRGS